MSSTNRSKSRNFHIADYYKTPENAIEEFWNEFTVNKDINKYIYNKNIKILEPCAGGLIGKDGMSYVNVLNKFGYKNISTIDIRQDSLATIKGDYLKMDCKNKYDLIITNPPFAIALDVIKKALNDVKNDGYVIMLLRLNFLEGKARREFWKHNMAKYIYVHSKRMSFTNDGKTDSIAYAHYVWEKGKNPDMAMIKVI